MIVPCGVHSCQLVVDEECYPVVDINIDLSSEIIYIILQEGNIRIWLCVNEAILTTNNRASKLYQIVRKI